MNKFDKLEINTPIYHSFFYSMVLSKKKMTQNVTLCAYTTKKTKISEGYLVRENVKSLSNSVTKFCDQGICEEFHFFRH